MDHRRNREFTYESKLERDFLHISLASNDVVDLHEQPPAVDYLDEDERPAKHTFDFLLSLRAGRRVAVDIKPRAKVERSGILTTQRLIKEQVGSAFADKFLVRTEEHLHPDDVHDSRLILRAWCLGSSEADTVLADLVHRLRGWCRLADLIAATGMEGAAFNAAVRLIGAGVLEVRENARISYECFVKYARG